MKTKYRTRRRNPLGCYFLFLIVFTYIIFLTSYIVPYSDTLFNNEIVVLITASNRQYISQTIESLNFKERPNIFVYASGDMEPGIIRSIKSFPRVYYHEERSYKQCENNFDLKFVDQYQNTGGIQQAKSDSHSRIFWRKKQITDFYNAVTLALEKYDSEWFIVLEDDVFYTSKNVKLDEFILHRTPFPLMILYGSYKNTAAVVYHKSILKAFKEYLILRCDVYPIDWLFYDFQKSIGLKPTIHSIFKHNGHKTSKPP